MNRKLLALVFLAPLGFVSCVAPTPNAGYFAMDPGQAAANRAYTHDVENESRYSDNYDRMSRAHATEVSTRHMPRSISTTNVYAPSYGGYRGW